MVIFFERALILNHNPECCAASATYSARIFWAIPIFRPAPILAVVDLYDAHGLPTCGSHPASQTIRWAFAPVPTNATAHPGFECSHRYGTHSRSTAASDCTADWPFRLAKHYQLAAQRPAGRHAVARLERSAANRYSLDLAQAPTGTSVSPCELRLAPGQSVDVIIKAAANIGAYAGEVSFKPSNSHATAWALQVPISVSLTNPTFVPSAFDLPIIRIGTDHEAPIEDTETYVNGSLQLDTRHLDGSAVSAFPLQIKGRGSSTWSMPKRPYRIKLNSKQSLLGMPSNKDWVLLANYADKTLLRTKVAFALGEIFGLGWTPRVREIELFLNGQYEGVYQLVERIQIDAHRVAINNLKEDDTEPPDITGGYLLEFDNRTDGPDYFITPRRLSVVIQDPSPLPAAQHDYISTYVAEAETALFSTDFASPTSGYASRLDVDSFILWFLVNEIFKNPDAALGTSCFFYKPRGGKLFMGPLWDFDLGAGNANHGPIGFTSYTGWHVRRALWIERLFLDPAFEARVAQRWNELKPAINLLLDHELPAWAEQLAQGQANNFSRWPILAQWVWPNAVVTGTYAGEVDFLSNWLRGRIAWLDAQWNL